MRSLQPLRDHGIDRLIGLHAAVKAPAIPADAKWKSSYSTDFIDGDGARYWRLIYWLMGVVEEIKSPCSCRGFRWSRLL